MDPRDAAYNDRLDQGTTYDVSMSGVIENYPLEDPICRFRTDPGDSSAHEPKHPKISMASRCAI